MITNAQVMANLARLGANPVARMILDSRFAVADESSIADLWAKYYDALRVLGLLDYSEEDWDCDDYAILAWAFIRAAYRRTNKREGLKPDAGINLGIFAYETQQGNHMLNFNPTPEGVIFFEPQPRNGRCGAPVHISQEDLISCFAYAI